MSRQQYLKFVSKTFKNIEKIIKTKNNDYCGQSDDPFFNLSLTEYMGVLSTQKGIFSRITDKYSRLASFMAGNKLQVKDEAVTDTLKDFIGYCVLMLALQEKNKRKSKRKKK